MKTKLVIGIDEAGYGPSMGPLVIGGTAWRVPIQTKVDAMHQMVEPEIRGETWRSEVRHIPIGDSKRILDGKHGWASLCAGARFLLELCFDRSPEWWTHLPKIAIHDWQRVLQVPWYAKEHHLTFDREDIAVNEGVSPVDVSEVLQQGMKKLRSCDFQLVGTRIRIFDEPEFNRLVELQDNKAVVLSETSLQLAKELALNHAIDDEAIEIYCDKHGGRNRYQAVLMHCFDNTWFQIHGESRAVSRYSATMNGHPFAIQFQVGGDSLLPSAAASILAKWTREWAMASLNRFWQSHSKVEIRPTAGYYVDALRFANDIKEIADRMGHRQSSWWRIK